MSASDSPRVLWVLDQPNVVPGSFSAILQLAGRIDRSAFEIIASTPKGGDALSAFSALGIECSTRKVRVSGRNPAYLQSAWSFRRFLKREAINLVYFPDHTRWRPAELLAARFASVPTVLHLRAPASRAMAADPSLRWAAAIVGNSSATLAALRGRVADSRLHVVLNGIDFAPFDVERSRLARGKRTNAPTVGLVGIFRPQKGIEHFLAMAAALRPARPQVRYLIVGEAARQHPELDTALRDRAAALGIADVVHFAGVRSDVAAVMGSLDVLVVPSLSEGFGRVIVEANAVGVPVVASNVGGIPEVVEDGVTGLLVPPADPDQLAAAVSRVLDDEAWRARVKTMAPIRVRERFSLASNVQALEAVWRSALRS